MHHLIDRFEEQVKSFNNKTRFSYAVAAGSAVAAWGLSYHMRLKFKSFVFLTGLSFYLVHSGLRWFNSRAMKNNLNLIGVEYASKYPAIKYSNIEYTKSTNNNH